jgi:hypothetical protein
MKKMAALLLSFFLLTATQLCAKSEDAPKTSASNTSSKRASAKGSTTKTTAKRSLNSKQSSSLKKNLTPVPARATSTVATPAREFVENTLLVMPYSRDDEDTQDLIKEVDGTITETIGEGNMTVWVVKFKDPKKFEEAEKKLAKDKSLKSVERDTVFNNQ